MNIAVNFVMTLLLISGSAIARGASDAGSSKAAAASETSADQDIGLIARYHFATHTPDFDRAREFYRKLGYTEGRSGFPLSNTHLMARALGMFDLCQYELVKGEVMSLPSSVNTANIDLLQFKIPFNGEPPYELPNHLGMAYAALLTTDLESDVAYLQSLGTEFLSEPFGLPGTGSYSSAILTACSTNSWKPRHPMVTMTGICT